jgi:phage-related protein
MQRLTRFEDDTVVSASTVMLTFRTISSTTFPQAMKAAADLAAMWGMDLTSAARMVGRALDAPGEGLGMLTRLGVRFTDQQKEMLQQLTATGRGAEAQAQILDILNSKFGGTAQAMVNTYAGRMEQLKNTFGNIKEEIGGAFLPVLEDLAKALTETFEGQGSAVTDFANGLKDAIYSLQTTWAGLVIQAAKVGAILDFLKSATASFASFWVTA